MPQFNLGSLSSTGNAILVVSAGDPPTLVLNHSTKNTVYIGTTNAVGSGNLLDATPLDPYASIVVNGNADVWAVAAIASQPATVYTYPNAINWTPKAVQPNILDPNSPYTVPSLGGSVVLEVPVGAQGLSIALKQGSASAPEDISVTGNQSGSEYLPTIGLGVAQHLPLMVPVLSDDDTSVTVTTGPPLTAPSVLVFTWIMNVLAVTPMFGGSSLSVHSTNPISDAVQGATVANFDTGLLANLAVFQIVAPAPGFMIWLGTARIEPDANGFAYGVLQDTGGNDIDRITQYVAGVPANAFRPSYGDIDYKFTPVGSVGTGLQIQNFSGAAMSFVGHVVYSLH